MRPVFAQRNLVAAAQVDLVQPDPVAKSTLNQNVI
jgi:hypothetical protein